MKRLMCLSLAFLILVETSYPVWIGLYFCIHQEYIQKELCINRALPEKNCQGKCFLNQQLKAFNQDSKQATQLPNSEYKTSFYPLSLYFENIFIWNLPPCCRLLKKGLTLYLESQWSENPDRFFHPPPPKG